MFDLSLIKNKWYQFSRKRENETFSEPIEKIQLKSDGTIGNSPHYNEYYWNIKDEKLQILNQNREITSIFDNIGIRNNKLHILGKFLPDQTVSHELIETRPLSSKINIYKYQELSSHRSGWPYAINCLWDIHNSNGTRFDDFIDASFSWKWTKAYKQFTPYNDPWIGVMHNPYKIPFPFDVNQNPTNYFMESKWKESVENCKGIYVLSNYLGEWLSEHVKCPVEKLIHPTGIPEEYFSWEKFKENHERGIVQVGWWLRRLISIFELPVTKLKKTMLHLGGPYVTQALNKEAKQYKKNKGKELNISNTEIVYYLKDLEYDELLSKNVVLLDLYAASANNAVVECIIRNTPMLIRDIPSVVEYLGKEYPLYFSDLNEAAKKVEDFGLLQETHEYLKSMDKNVFRGKYFVESIRESSIYKSI